MGPWRPSGAVPVALSPRWGLVWARTNKEKGRAGISCFILEPGTPGFTARGGNAR